MTGQIETKHPRFLLFCRAAAWAYFLFTLYALLSPRPFGDFEIPIPAFSVIHAAAFAVLGFLFELARGTFSRRIAWFSLLLYGPLTEVLQPLTGRYFEWIDIFEDTVGVALGVIAARLLILCFARRRTKGAPAPDDSAPR
ncbi:MAG: VanZ family protein [Thermoguttaceae bacterium]|nr:VanZ family protein [Thermoguttaceae bacterium]